MTTEQELREKLRMIEALFAGAATHGERLAAMAARDRIKEKLKGFEARERAEEMKFTLGDGWNLRLFLALCRRRSTVMPPRNPLEWKEAFTVEEAAEAMSLGRTNTYALIKEGRLGVVRIGARVMVPKEEITNFLRRETVREACA